MGAVESKEKDMQSAIGFVRAAENAWADIEANPILYGLAEEAEYVRIEARRDLEKELSITPPFREMYHGGYDVVIYFPYERKAELRPSIIDLGYTKKIVDVNCFFTLYEYFRLPNEQITQRGTIRLAFYRKTQEGEHIGKNCTVGSDTFEMKRATLQCKL